jgi:hypothetical protein
MVRYRGCIVVLLIATAGCSTDLSSAVMPGVRLASYKSAYVACHPGDDANLCGLIAAQLARRGLTAVTSSEADQSRKADVLVTYEDRWTWDITMYLLTLRIDVRDPRTNVLLATSRVYRTSLARQGPADMVQEAVTALFVPKG